VQSYLGLTLADGLSTMLMKAGDEFIVILRRCDTRLDSKKLKKVVGTSKVRMANPDEYSELTASLPLGAARVLNPGLTTYLDEQLFETEYLTSGSGSFTCSVTVRAEDLKKLPDSHVADICVNRDADLEGGQQARRVGQ
jgi:prolyl-tRNA editing enzyme YbaK/EbsC (Cys-tRNA(Pro) deacylase)